jgi:hypothetical protein
MTAGDAKKKKLRNQWTYRVGATRSAQMSVTADGLSAVDSENRVNM